jgi:hypothetical protein
MRMKISRIMKIWLKIQNSKRWLRTLTVFTSSQQASRVGKRSRILTVEKDHVIWEGKKDSLEIQYQVFNFFVKSVSFWSDKYIC